jgi:hypothetical protein
MDAAITGDNSVTRFWELAPGLDDIGEESYMGYTTGVGWVNEIVFSSQVHSIFLETPPFHFNLNSSSASSQLTVLCEY